MNILLVILWGQATFAISNIAGSDKQEKVYMRPPNERGPTTWQSGIKCLQAIGSAFLSTVSYRAKLNMIITHSSNMTTPASQIQEQYLIMKNQAVSFGSTNKLLGSYLMSVVSDSEALPKQTFLSDYIVHTNSYVIIVDSINQVYKLFKEYISRMQSWNPGARFLILYNHFDDRNRGLEVANKIYTILLRTFYVNTVSVLYAVNNTGYDFYVLDNFNKDACRTVKSKKVATCDMGVIPNEMIVRYNINQLVGKASLQNCTFYMCAAIAAPFIETDCIKGFEMELITIIKEKLGFQLDVDCSNFNRGVRGNGTWTDLLGLLNNRSCDFIIGGFFSDNEVREDFWASDSYLYDSHTWFIASAKHRPPWKALFTIYQPNMMLCISIVYLITWFFWLAFGCILPEKEAHKSSILTAINSWGVTLGASVNERPECHTTRIFFIGLCLYSLNVTSVYTSKLIAVFANPGYEHQISTIEEVIQQGIPYGGPAENRDWFENPDDIKIYTGYNESGDFVPRKHNLRAVLTGERVILANRMFMLSMQDDQLYGFPANVFSSSVEIIAKRGFPFLKRFNALIRQMKSGGFFSKIENDFRYENTFLVKIRRLRDEVNEAVIVLTIYHMEGAFAFLIFGILLSFVAFAGERINNRYFHPWLCKKFNWNIETEVEKHHRTRWCHRIDGRRLRKNRQKQVAVASTRDEMRMKKIRFTPLKSKKIRV